MLPPHGRLWSPIEDLPDDWESKLVNPQTQAHVQVWSEQAAELRERRLFKQFLEKLQRQWSIETGVIENLYTLSDGATMALIEKGLDAALISHEDTDLEPVEVIIRVQDHYNAIQGLYQFASGLRPLGTSYIKELHQVLTAHQDTYQALDVLGNRVTRKLPRGDWKLLPNSVRFPDGTLFEYCPPEHVAQEMDNLLDMHHAHAAVGVPNDVEAAWLHHRFTLIHPFTDGNGRVARCLATLLLLRDWWLPLVITRKDKPDYINALRRADDGDLSPLVDLFGSLQRRAIREALSLTEDVIHEATAIEGILASVKAKFGRERVNRSQQIEEAYRISDDLHDLATQRLKAAAVEINEAIQDEGPGYKAFQFGASRRSDRSGYHFHQIISTAQALDYFANLRTYQAWSALGIATEQRTEILFSFHGIGHETSGILGCSAMAYIREKTEDGGSSIGPVTPLDTEPFEFTYLDKSADVRKRFQRWLDTRVVAGLDYWQKNI